jgi:hypothetical protein
LIAKENPTAYASAFADYCGSHSSDVACEGAGGSSGAAEIAKSGKGGKLHAGAAAGIAIAVIAVVGIAVGVTVWVVKRKKAGLRPK